MTHTSGRTVVDDERRDTELRRARQAVRRSEGYWRRAGVPRPHRRRKAEELHDHLLAAIDDGRRVRDVVGDDLPAFAAEWAQADRRHPVVEGVLWFVGIFTAGPAALALLAPLLSDHERTGLPAESAAFQGALLLFLFALMVFRWQRARLTTQQAAMLAVALFTGYTVIFGVGRQWAGDAFISVPAPVAWTLLATGVSIGLLTSWLRRTQRI